MFQRVRLLDCIFFDTYTRLARLSILLNAKEEEKEKNKMKRSSCFCVRVLDTVSVRVVVRSVEEAGCPVVEDTWSVDH